MESKFARGDRVRVKVGFSCPARDLSEGDEFTVFSLDSSGFFLWLEGVDGMIKAERFERVPPMIYKMAPDGFTAEKPAPPPARLADDMKPTNPKDGVGSTKLPLHLVPDTLLIYAAMAFAEGDEKYGMYNFRVAGVRASIYLDALGRHMMRFKNGEWADKISKVPHLASAAACISILIDGFAMGNITDDRPYPMDVDEEIARGELVIAHVRELHADKNPHRWTIKDAE